MRSAQNYVIVHWFNIEVSARPQLEDKQVF